MAARAFANRWGLGIAAVVAFALIAAGAFMRARDRTVHSPTPPEATTIGTRSPVASGDSDAGTTVPSTLARSTEEIRSTESDARPRRFDDTRDLFALVAAQARRAYEGDAEAQYQVGRALRECAEITATYGTDPNGIPALRARDASTQEVDALQSHVRRCMRFANEDAFHGLPADVGARAWYRWLELAAEGGSGPAAGYLAYLDPTITTSRAAEFDAFSACVSQAVVSGDPEAWFFVGLAKARAAQDTDRLRAGIAAWMLAACDAGFDCTATNVMNPVMECARVGETRCPPDYTIIDQMKAALSGEQFAASYALAERIRVAQRDGDLEALRTLARE